MATGDNTLWQGVSGTNNPCPSGFRLPTDTELDNERSSWSSQNPAGAFASPLKLTATGRRSYYDGTFSGVGSHGRYWSSTVSSSNSYYLAYGSGYAYVSVNYRADGYSIRCIKD